MNMAAKCILYNGRIYTETEIIPNGYLVLAEGKIIEIAEGQPSIREEKKNDTEFIDCKGKTILPGFMDLHIHGVQGADMMDGTASALTVMKRELPKEGTTSFLATTITEDSREIEKALRQVAEDGNQLGDSDEIEGAELLGVHLEGPFISSKRAGAQPEQHILPPNIDLFKQWEEASGHRIKLVTLAPEIEDGKELVSYMKERGIVASIGHSDAVYDEVKTAVETGVTHATHLFNGMRGMHHREPGVAGSVLLLDEILVELIPDGIHIIPEMVDLSYRVKGEDGLVLITDAMRAKGLGQGQYQLAGQKVDVDEKQATLEDGTLAGSILKMNDGVKNIMEFTGCTLESAVKMASSNPAKQLSIFDRKGSIATGKDADLVLVNSDMEVLLTICRGKVVYRRECWE
ncbi:N-acetylglucosamine-6-phosphate deacetylase [Evansella tamaricis]|uniref:N-acetylglucosamine-6-phosphate deacetylase n=1 Tax=Evansella tamaricis TaxID=2069301 RepID=A0ABS6JDW4_9BACI|nr:N-acetylglucosamine-6-phosphate deacetylase [Evansella tamaricis]MBU9711872.1 N-acetylglucosamine-6-phosphate deacetylase [Evansella tamaricis]